MPFPQALFVGVIDGRIQAARLDFITESHRMLYGQAIARTSASLEGNNGCDLNLILLQGNRKTILVELIPKLTPPSWS